MNRADIVLMVASAILVSGCRWREARSQYSVANAAQSAEPPISEEDIPPVGRSVFDYLTISDNGTVGAQKVPFPFEKLIEEIRAKANGPIASAMLPVGRSLQKLEAAPHFFESPRVVFGVTESRDDSLLSHPLRLSGRIYIGYLEPADQLEVISYNEALGRFEFQVVQNYSGDQKVLYANRRFCESCHQAKAPIFPQELWPETNFASKIVERIKAHHPTNYLGLPVDGTKDVPEFDNAIRPGIMLPRLQSYWLKGCGVSGQDGARCRGLFFLSLLATAFPSSLVDPGPAAQLYEKFQPVWDPFFRDVYPDGFRFRSSVIRSRNPFTNGTQTEDPISAPDPGVPDLEVATIMIKAAREMPDTVDPLNPFIQDIGAFGSDFGQTPIAAADWLTKSPEGIQTRFNFYRAAIYSPDIAEIKRVAHDKSPLKDVPAKNFRGFGKISAPVNHAPAQVSASLEAVAIGNDALLIDAINLRPSFFGNIVGTCQLIAGGKIACALTPDPQEPAPEDKLLKANLVLNPLDSRDLEVSTLQYADSASTKLSAICSIVTLPPEANQDPSSVKFSCINGSFGSIVDGVERLIAKTKSGESDAFAPIPYSRRRVMQALFDELGVSRRADGCCDAVKPAYMPDPITLESTGLTAALIVKPSLRPFATYCYPCHHTPDSGVPDFMHGSTEDEITGKVTDLASRMHFRLKKGTMPPMASDERALLETSADGQERKNLLKILEEEFGANP